MTININPFIVSGTIPKPYFCDRVKETEVLNMAIENQMNVVITSPRRMGKTALVDFVFHQESIHHFPWCDVVSPAYSEGCLRFDSTR